MAISEITPSAVKIDKRVSRVAEGDIKIPAFQRRFVWDQEQVIELLDSIYRDYPIGSTCCGPPRIAQGNVFKSFLDLCAAIHIELDCEAVLDGEIVILDANGRPQFYDLLRRRGRGEPVFYGGDLRERPLLDS